MGFNSNRDDGLSSNDVDEEDAETTEAGTVDDVPLAPVIIGAKENSRVTLSRLVVIVVLLLSAGLTSFFVYSFVSDEEQKSFESDFRGIAAEIIEVTQAGEASITAAMEEFSTLTTSMSLATNQEWPYVTIPDFERRAQANRKVSQAYTMQVATLIEPTDDARAKANEYLNDNIDWYYEACNITGATPGLISPYIHNISTLPSLTPATGDEQHIIFTQWSPPPERFSIALKADFGRLMRPRWRFMSDTKRTARSVGQMEIIEGETEPDLVILYYQPIFTDFSGEQVLGAFVAAYLRFRDQLSDILHDDDSGIIVVLQNTCNETHTYEINGVNAIYLNNTDLHDPAYDDLGVPASITMDFDEASASDTGLSCAYHMTIYPSDKLRGAYDSMAPVIYTGGVLLVFLFTSFVFIVYDRMVQSRQNTVMDSAVKTEAIVSALIPDQFRGRLMDDSEDAKPSKSEAFRARGAKGHLENFLSNKDEDGVFLSSSKPVADLYPNATVLFADICGFTAWSSVREPTQVFTLLESIYRSFDNIAKSKSVFKVETVGDSYVAVTGVPVPRKDHAVVMTRFARDCMKTLPRVVLSLERLLGPGTGDLRMRFGLHSGPVTAGVLRGEKARFQLFGDTVNTAARIESTGSGNRVHMSDACAHLLIDAGKSMWIEKRKDPVHAKGKGELQTYWLRVGTQSRRSIASASLHSMSMRSSPSVGNSHLSTNVHRLVQWNVEQMLRLLKHMVAARANGKKTSSVVERAPVSVPLAEVTEIITLPRFDADCATTSVDPNTVKLGPRVGRQLYDYITMIAHTYHNNPFHNFEHASHVAMSIHKLLSRIVAPDVENEMNGSTREDRQLASVLHDHTYGITSDPLTHFAVVFASLIHDADHRGVPNGQLAKEETALAATYNNKSIAEQNSVDVSWDILMRDDFKDLRACIYSNTDEQKRFRQIVVNSVMATDIFDKELSALRKNRWDRAFSEEKASSSKSVNRRATIVIEHIIQASDVAHTMQHWQVYCNWNSRLFEEMYLAYLNGRSDKDPSEGWFKGEIWFFDCYVIPLAKKLENCGVFGVSSDEYLNYAQENRKEWEQKGQAIVARMVERCKALTQQQEFPSEQTP